MKNKDKDIFENYFSLLEEIRIEFSHFMNLCEKGRRNVKKSLAARKQSITLRNILKNKFRKVSIEMDKERRKLKK